MFGDALGDQDEVSSNALGGRDQANLEMHLETESSSELRDALGGRD